MYTHICGMIILPIVFIYFLFIPKKIRLVICHDFKCWCEWQLRPFSFMGFAVLFVELREFRSVVYKRLKWRRMFVAWLFHGQFNLTLACNNIGPGLIVQHGYSTVVCANRIGKNFKVNQCVNIVWNGKEQCVIGDNVTVFTGAIIVGGVKIGNNVTVGAGAVVVKDIPNNCLVVGNPMRIIYK